MKRMYLGPLLGGLLPTALDIWDNRDDMGGAMAEVARGWTGFDIDNKTWDVMDMVPYWGPLVGGMIAHKLAVVLGINKFLPKWFNI